MALEDIETEEMIYSCSSCGNFRDYTSLTASTISCLRSQKSIGSSNRLINTSKLHHIIMSRGGKNRSSNQRKQPRSARPLFTARPRILQRCLALVTRRSGLNPRAPEFRPEIQPELRPQRLVSSSLNPQARVFVPPHLRAQFQNIRIPPDTADCSQRDVESSNSDKRDPRSSIDESNDLRSQDRNNTESGNTIPSNSGVRRVRFECPNEFPPLPSLADDDPASRLRRKANRQSVASIRTIAGPEPFHSITDLHILEVIEKAYAMLNLNGNCRGPYPKRFWNYDRLNFDDFQVMYEYPLLMSGRFWTAGDGEPGIYRVIFDAHGVFIGFTVKANGGKRAIYRVRRRDEEELRNGGPAGQSNLSLESASRPADNAWDKGKPRFEK